MKNEMTLTFSAQNENVVFSRTAALAFLVNLKINVNTLNEIKTAISEAVTNSIVHGYQNDPTKLVELKMNIEDSLIIIEVIDYGIGIEDIEKAKEPLFTTKEEMDRAGLGFTIMEVFMDNVEVLSEVGLYTKVIMRKHYVEEI